MRRRDAWPPGERLQRGSTSNKENAIVAVSHLQVNNSLVLLIYALSLKLLFLLQSSEVCSASRIRQSEGMAPAHPAVSGPEADCQRRPGREFG